MISQKIEDFLRERAQKLRLENQKKKAQKDKAEDFKVIKNLDKSLSALIDRRGGVGKSTSPGPPAIGIIEHVMLQREAKSRGMLKKDAAGKWAYEKPKVDRNNRPAEKLVKGKTKGMKQNKGRSM